MAAAARYVLCCNVLMYSWLYFKEIFNRLEENSKKD